MDRFRLERIQKKIGFCYGFGVDSRGKGGGLALWWREEVNLSVMSYSDYHIDAVISDRISYRVTLFYGMPATNLRDASWDLIRNLNSLSELPWMIFGDFNETLFSWEMKGNRIRGEWQMRRFREVLQECNLVDVPFRGNKFTFSNRRLGNSETKARLDRAVVNNGWLELFPNSVVLHEARVFSDHAPLIISRGDRKTFKKGKLFRFEPMWIRKDGYEDVLLSSWATAGGENSLLSDQLKACAESLSKWSRRNFGGLGAKLRKLQKDITQVQMLERTVDNAKKEAALSKELEEWQMREEVYWRQRSRVEWLKEGDLNTKYFHRKASARKRINRIERLMADDTTWEEDPRKMGLLVLDHFRGIFRTSRGCPLNFNESQWSTVVDRVPMEMKSMLLAPFDSLEIQDALFQMSPTKAPGLDGFSALFYQRGWHTIRASLTSNMLKMFRDKRLEPGMNQTLVTLIPKKRNPERLEDFRPISLCNVSMKILTKVLANRLKSVLPSLISEYQSAFIPGKLITDNVLIANELLHYIRTRGNLKCGFMALKLDMSKAYDRVEWDFLYIMMIKLGLPNAFVDLIMMCIGTVSYRFRINEEITEELFPERGLRQGDPLSPYLFLICSEWLSNKLAGMQHSKRLKGIKICQGAPEISHLFFADDSMLFLKATIANAVNLKEALGEYEILAGQKINYQKSEILFSGHVPQSLRNQICDLMGVKEVRAFSKYLGMPFNCSLSRSERFKCVVERVWEKLNSWNISSLSIAGKATMIKSVIQALPTYIMSCFKIPVSLVKRIVSMVAKFWWKSSAKGNGIHWCKFKALCRDTMDGGLGFKNLALFNDAMLGKQVWRLLNNTESLMGKLFKAKYYKNSSPITCQLGSRPSMSWRNIWEVGRVIKDRLMFKVEDQSWVWMEDPGGLYSVKSAYSWLSKISDQQVRDQVGEQSDRGRSQMFWKTIWKLELQPKEKMFAWRLFHNFLPAKFNLVKRGMCVDSKCPVCGFRTESSLHSLINCWWASACWKSMGISLDFNNYSFNDLSCWLWLCYKQCTGAELALIIKGARAIWYNRNVMNAGGLGSCPIRTAKSISFSTSMSGNWAEKFIISGISGGFKWQPPPIGTFKWNVDGGWTSAMDRGSYGVCCRDANSLVWIVEANGLEPVKSSVETEVIALHRAMHLASSLGHERVIFETDCSQVFMAVMKNEVSASGNQRFIEDCRHLLAGHWRWSLNLIPREANGLADKLAFRARQDGWSWNRVDSIPFPV